MIGLSLSLCVLDICMGKVKLEDVEKIFTGTALADENAWVRGMAKYKLGIWRNFPDRADEVVSQLRQAGKIIQPRLTHGGMSPFAPDIYWVTSEGDIRWQGPH